LYIYVQCEEKLRAGMLELEEGHRLMPRMRWQHCLHNTCAATYITSMSVGSSTCAVNLNDVVRWSQPVHVARIEGSRSGRGAWKREWRRTVGERRANWQYLQSVNREGEDRELSKTFTTTQI
jgi:hypothetical protein